MSTFPIADNLKKLNRKQLLTRIRRSEERICAEYALIAEAKRILSECCPHDLFTAYVWEKDAAQGTTRTAGRKCLLCSAVDYHADGTWTPRGMQDFYGFPPSERRIAV
jgi:hypothetical protein